MGASYPEEFGSRVRAHREGQGLSQDALAAAAGLHRTHISLIERGQRSVRLETVVALATAMRIQPADLMPPIGIQPTDAAGDSAKKPKRKVIRPKGV